MLGSGCRQACKQAGNRCLQQLCPLRTQFNVKGTGENTGVSGKITVGINQDIK